jgi:hypothetical protein
MVEDLRKAGLNPILAAGSPSGASASGATYQTENPVNAAVSSAVQAQAMRLAERRQSNEDAIARSIVEKNSAQALELTEKAKTHAPSIAEMGERSKIYVHQADMFGASASFNRANVEYLSKLGAESIGRLQKLESDLRTAEKQRDLLEAEVKTAGTQALRNIAESNLARKNAEIAEIRKEGERRYNESLQIKNRLDSLGIGKAESDARYYEKAGTKWFNENVFNPFKWSGR